jgi:predicted acyltransferase (DUF342 family)
VVNNIAVQIGAGQVTVKGTFTVDGWVSAGTTTIDGGNITANTLSCSAIKTSTLDAVTISLGTTGSNGIIKSSNFSAGSAGFQISGDGSAEFNNVIIRGTLKACTLDTGNTMAVKGSIQSDNYVVATSGWKLFGDGTAIFYAIQTNSGIDVGGAIYVDQEVSTERWYRLGSDISASAADGRSIYTPNGTDLYFKGSDGTSRKLTP